jgi:hypothetical protein
VTAPGSAAADCRARGDSRRRIGYRGRKDVKGTVMADHKHGSMNTSVQEKTFEGFVTWSVRVAAVAIGILVFLAIFNS